MANRGNSANNDGQVPPTYRQAALQMAAYRSVRAVVNGCLAGRRLNATQWAILGAVYDNPEQLRVTDLATQLQVEGAFVTNLVRQLLKAGYLTHTIHPTDNRARLLSLTTEGRQLVETVEPELMQRLQPLADGLKPADVTCYFSALGTVIANATRQ